MEGRTSTTLEANRRFLVMKRGCQPASARDGEQESSVCLARSPNALQTIHHSLNEVANGLRRRPFADETGVELGVLQEMLEFTFAVVTEVRRVARDVDPSDAAALVRRVDDTPRHCMDDGSP